MFFDTQASMFAMSLASEAEPSFVVEFRFALHADGSLNGWISTPRRPRQIRFVGNRGIILFCGSREAQSQLATLVQEAQSKGSGDEMFEQPEQQSTLHASWYTDWILLVPNFCCSRKDASRSACEVFQGWLQQELHAHEERLRSGLREDLSHFFRPRPCFACPLARSDAAPAAALCLPFPCRQRPPHLAAQSQPQAKSLRREFRTDFFIDASTRTGMAEVQKAAVIKQS